MLILQQHHSILHVPQLHSRSGPIGYALQRPDKYIVFFILLFLLYFCTDEVYIFTIKLFIIKSITYYITSATLFIIYYVLYCTFNDIIIINIYIVFDVKYVICIVYVAWCGHIVVVVYYADNYM